MDKRFCFATSAVRFVEFGELDWLFIGILSVGLYNLSNEMGSRESRGELPWGQSQSMAIVVNKTKNAPAPNPLVLVQTKPMVTAISKIP